MRREKRWRYWCDHCKKSGSSGGHMKRHERGCVRNPGRVCGMCAKAEIDQKPADVLDRALLDGDVDALRKAADGCPACMLAAVIRARIAHDEEHGADRPDHESGYFPPSPPGAEFVWSTERDRFWADMNEARMEAERHYG